MYILIFLRMCVCFLFVRADVLLLSDADLAQLVPKLGPRRRLRAAILPPSVLESPLHASAALRAAPALRSALDRAHRQRTEDEHVMIQRHHTHEERPQEQSQQSQSEDPSSNAGRRPAALVVSVGESETDSSSSSSSSPHGSNAAAHSSPTRSSPSSSYSSSSLSQSPSAASLLASSRQRLSALQLRATPPSPMAVAASGAVQFGQRCGQYWYPTHVTQCKTACVSTNQDKQARVEY